MSGDNESAGTNAGGHGDKMEHGDELSCSRGVKSCTESYARLVANAVCLEVAWRYQFLDDTVYASLPHCASVVDAIYCWRKCYREASCNSQSLYDIICMSYVTF